MICAEIPRSTLLAERRAVAGFFVEDDFDFDFDFGFIFGVIATIDWINEGARPPSDFLKDANPNETDG